MGMMLKVSTNEARIIAGGLAQTIGNVNAALELVIASEAADDDTGTLMTLLSTKMRAYGLAVPLWQALGMSDEDIASNIKRLEGEE